jgi:hypothetical protein
MMPRAMARKPRLPEKLENACRTANLQHISIADRALRITLRSAASRDDCAFAIATRAGLVRREIGPQRRQIEPNPARTKVDHAVASDLNGL